MLVQMKEIGVEQLCPNGANLTPEKVEKWHEQDFNVRAWGIKDEHLMMHAYDCGVDGMTVNFPDKLISYIKEKR
jgi:glycerophosphoryl diester phosphodiesterase